MLLVPDFITIAIFVFLPIGRSLTKGSIYYTVCRVLSAIGLVALTIYRPLIYIAQLQDQLNRYSDKGVQLFFSRIHECNASYSKSGTDFAAWFALGSCSHLLGKHSWYSLSWYSHMPAASFEMAEVR